MLKLRSFLAAYLYNFFLSGEGKVNTTSIFGNHGGNGNASFSTSTWCAEAAKTTRSSRRDADDPPVADDVSAGNNDTVFSTTNDLHSGTRSSREGPQNAHEIDLFHNVDNDAAENNTRFYSHIAEVVYNSSATAPDTSFHFRRTDDIDLVDPRPPIFKIEEDLPAQHNTGPHVVLGGGHEVHHDLGPDPRRRTVTFQLQSPDDFPSLETVARQAGGGASSTAKKSTTSKRAQLPRAPAPSPVRNKPWKREGIKKELDAARRRITRIKEERPARTSSSGLQNNYKGSRWDSDKAKAAPTSGSSSSSSTNISPSRSTSTRLNNTISSPAPPATTPKQDQLEVVDVGASASSSARRGADATSFFGAPAAGARKETVTISDKKAGPRGLRQAAPPAFNVLSSGGADVGPGASSSRTSTTAVSFPIPEQPALRLRGERGNHTAASEVLASTTTTAEQSTPTSGVLGVQMMNMSSVPPPSYFKFKPGAGSFIPHARVQLQEDLVPPQDLPASEMNAEKSSPEADSTGSSSTPPGVEEEFFHTPEFVATVHEFLRNFPVDNANFAAALKSGNAEWPEKLRKEMKKEHDEGIWPLVNQLLLSYPNEVDLDQLPHAERTNGILNEDQLGGRSAPSQSITETSSSSAAGHFHGSLSPSDNPWSSSSTSSSGHTAWAAPRRPGVAESVSSAGTPPGGQNQFADRREAGGGGPSSTMSGGRARSGRPTQALSSLTQDFREKMQLSRAKGGRGYWSPLPDWAVEKLHGVTDFDIADEEAAEHESSRAFQDMRQWKLHETQRRFEKDTALYREIRKRLALPLSVEKMNKFLQRLFDKSQDVLYIKTEIGDRRRRKATRINQEKIIGTDYAVRKKIFENLLKDVFFSEECENREQAALDFFQMTPSNDPARPRQLRLSLITPGKAAAATRTLAMHDNSAVMRGAAQLLQAQYQYPPQMVFLDPITGAVVAPQNYGIDGLGTTSGRPAGFALQLPPEHQNLLQHPRGQQYPTSTGAQPQPVKINLGVQLEKETLDEIVMTNGQPFSEPRSGQPITMHLGLTFNRQNGQFVGLYLLFKSLKSRIRIRVVRVMTEQGASTTSRTDVEQHHEAAGGGGKNDATTTSTPQIRTEIMFTEPPVYGLGGNLNEENTQAVLDRERLYCARSF
ncbi:unnamed protein product [Amoebophrya sp. A120]|nr:unnamed protein product [Amoebophrya sp. A120]|eukprot:GSA120T00022437001.1